MLISILTLFPEIFAKPLAYSILGRAKKKKLLTIDCINIRDFAKDKHKSVDDKPYGGGVGMVIRVDVVAEAIEYAKRTCRVKECHHRVLLTDPRGEIFVQKTVRSLSQFDHIIIVCGHYEGIDQRIYHFVDKALSIGKFILSGGELPAMVIVDSLTRLLPGVLSKKEAILLESYSEKNLLEWPQYTRPAVYKKFSVPKVLLSGNHRLIEAWRKKQMKTS